MTAESVAAGRLTRLSVLVGYALLAACTQLLWLSFAPVTTEASRAMGVSEGAVGDLAGIFPLLYVILALPAGRWLDQRFERALPAGAALTAAGGLLRLAGPDSYGWVMAGQVVIAAGQPLVLNAITKIAARYFPPQQRTAAVSAGSAALFAGILAAVLTGGPLLRAGGLQLLLGVQAAAGVVGALWVIAATRTPPLYPGDATVTVSLRWLRGDRTLWLLGGLLFIGMGIFNAVATWLDAILSHFGHGSASGYLIALMTVAGIAGAAVLPEAAARRDRRRGLLLVAVCVTIVAFLAIAAVPTVAVTAAALFVDGFFLLAGLPVALDWSEQKAGPQRAGAAAGFLLLAGNLGGVVLVLIVQGLLGNPYLSLAGIAVAALLGAVLVSRLPARAVSPS